MALRAIACLMTVFAAVTVIGCGGTGGTDTTLAAGPTARASVGDAVPAKSSVAGLGVTVSTDKTTYKTGDPITITVSATNAGNSPLTLRYSSASDLVKWGYIIAQNDKIVTYEFWNGHRLVLPAVIGTDTYAPGETKTFTYTFPLTGLPTNDPDTIHSLSPGTYQVYARIPALVYNGAQALRTDIPTPASDPVTITVTP
jgi:hypothetical protein